MGKGKANREEKERQEAFDSLPPRIREEMTDEEKELFLHSETWPEELFEKLKEFMVP
ncbi:MAG: hypothetical protein R6V54_02980 [Desulfobacteraceae bacterium]